ncbi:hypothetical protein FHQ08_07355 [Lactobacillus sp. CC-MHH1034]|uniref:hypothetical protein n=1 Tax=Agrilactobacillus fermenti TaxID=2586909 RepID=UPI001E31A8B0|nr:hypothetical protein [Agrilactobacillus fermenti]MCD2256536.1 hypothetical protein [Agrilactobacillus fermenti]
MSETFTGGFTTDTLFIDLHDLGKLYVLSKLATPIKPAVMLYFQKSKLVGIGTEQPKQTFDRILCIDPPETIRQINLEHFLINQVPAVGNLELTDTTSLNELPEELVEPIDTYFQAIKPLLIQLGFNLTSQARSYQATTDKKTRHRWTKAISEMPFYVNYRGSRGVVFWTNRNELTLKTGAQMTITPPLNKDGTLGFSARFAQQLRQEHSAQFHNYVTTSDITLKSVNEVGLFLYFAGTNSWLQLKDRNGRSIHDWTAVE